MTVPNVSDTNNKSDTHDLVYKSLDRSGVPKGQQCQFLFELLFLALAGGGGGETKIKTQACQDSMLQRPGNCSGSCHVMDSNLYIRASGDLTSNSPASAWATLFLFAKLKKKRSLHLLNSHKPCKVMSINAKYNTHYCFPISTIHVPKQWQETTCLRKQN